MAPLVALIVVVPAFNADANPDALIVAVAVLEDAHVALLVKSCVVPSLNVPVAVNCRLFPAATEGFAGVTAIDVNVGAVTVRVVEPTTLPLVAEIVVVPAFSADANPEALIVAVVVLEEAHVTLLVRFFVDPSLYVPVAVNCTVVPAAAEGFAGVTAIEVNVGDDWPGAIFNVAELVLEKAVPAVVVPEMVTRYAVVVETDMDAGTKKVTRRVLPIIVVTALAVV